MKTTMFIPEKLKVGFQNRNDTYTKKLAYVIYFDEKGKLRKETSWENWRDKSIDPEEFENVPIEGFVLNKKVGDYSYHYHREAKIRVYDPRGFEFEISVQNLLYILECNACSPGKGLEGEFVYAWDGTDLVLLPVNSMEYQEIQNYTKKIKNAEYVKPKDFKVGYIYKHKKDGNYIYLGYFDYYDYDGQPKKMHHFMWEESFYRDMKNKNSEYLWTTNYAALNGKFIEELNPIDDALLKEFFELYQGNIHFSPLDASKTIAVPYQYSEFEAYCNKQYHMSESFYSDIMMNTTICKDMNTPSGKLKIRKPSTGWGNYWLQNSDGTNYFTIKEVFDMLLPYYRKHFLANGLLHHYEPTINASRKDLI